MNAIIQIICISCLIHLSTEVSDNSNYNFISAISQYMTPFRQYSNQQPSNEFGDRIYKLKNGIYKFIRFINPFSYFWENQRHNSRALSTPREDSNQNNPNKYNTNILSNSIDDLNIKSAEENQDRSILESSSTNVFDKKTFLNQMGKSWRKQHRSAFDTHIGESQNMRADSSEKKLNSHGMSPKFYSDNSDQLISSPEYTYFRKDKQLIKDDSQSISRQRGLPQNSNYQTGSFRANDPQNNYNTDIFHTYKSLAAFNLNVAPFLTRRTRSAGSSPIIVSPYLSHNTRTYLQVPDVGASHSNIYYYHNVNNPSLSSPHYYYSVPVFNEKSKY